MKIKKWNDIRNLPWSIKLFPQLSERRRTETHLTLRKIKRFNIEGDCNIFQQVSKNQVASKPLHRICIQLLRWYGKPVFWMSCNWSDCCFVRLLFHKSLAYSRILHTSWKLKTNTLQRPYSILKLILGTKCWIFTLQTCRVESSK